MTIKRLTGKLRFEGSPEAEERHAGFDALTIGPAHAGIAGDPLHHRDPLLVAQAQPEGLTVVTRDPAFDP